ncbi:MAG: response regulator [Bacteroidota bacterium]
MDQHLSLWLIEDNMAIANLIPIALEDALLLPVDYRHFETGEAFSEAFHLIRSLAAPMPSLILLDMNLPDSNGLRLLSEVRQYADRISLPVIMFSSHQNEDLISMSYFQGANAFIEKPFDYDELMEILNGCISFWGNKRFS